MDDGDDRSAAAGVSRRAFLRRMAALAFAVPVISSFTLDSAAHPVGVRPVDAHQFANQYMPNQITPDKFFSGQVPNQYFPNQTFACQYYPNQLPA
jgi:hypothetical protein